jgi:uncharacterized protein (DUF1800 family)
MSVKDGPWAAFEPSAKDPWDLAKVAHLHRRAAFGAPRDVLLRDVQAGPQGCIERLLKPPEATPDEKDTLASLRQGVISSNDPERLKAWWLYQVLYGADPLREKLSLFWHGHFATSNRKVGSIALMLGQNELIRKHALENFGDLLTGMVSDPAMLIWLDGANSDKKRPNENFAREFLELFTVGIGHYTEADIRQGARAFTGWGRSGPRQFGETPTFMFDPARFDAGTKTFLGKTGPWKAADIVRITLEQPACADFLCRKLYRHLVSESAEPSAELIQPLAGELRGRRYDVGYVIGVILRSRHFFAEGCYRQRIKGPVEFTPGLVHALEIPPGSARLLAVARECDRQGQELFAPPNVKGWEGGRTWLNSTTVLERGNWIADVVWGNPDLGMPPYDPLAWAQRYGIAPERVAPAMIDLLLQGDLDDRARDLILRTGADGRPDRLRKAIQLTLNCPDYQLA